MASADVAPAALLPQGMSSFDCCGATGLGASSQDLKGPRNGCRGREIRVTDVLVAYKYLL